MKDGTWSKALVTPLKLGAAHPPDVLIAEHLEALSVIRCRGNGHRICDASDATTPAKAWDAFAADPEWIKARKDSIDKSGQIVAMNDIEIHRATAYAPVKFANEETQSVYSLTRLLVAFITFGSRRFREDAQLAGPPTQRAIPCEKNKEET
jgi:hypothetical protein